MNHPPAPPPSHLVTIGWVYGIGDLALAMSILEAAKLHPMPHTANMVRNCWHNTMALGGTQLCVPAAEAGTAQELLADLERSTPTRMRWFGVLLALAAFFYVGIPPPATGFVAARPAATVQRVKRL